MALKDAAGLVKMYAMINIERYQNVAVGDTVAECQDAYLQMLAQEGTISQEAAAEVAASTQTSGTIATMAQAVVDGNSHFYVTLEGDDAIYDFALPAMLPIVTYQVGDEVEFSYAEGEASNPVTSFGDATATGTAFEDAETGEEGEPAAEAAGADEATDSAAETDGAEA